MMRGAAPRLPDTMQNLTMEYKKCHDYRVARCNTRNVLLLTQNLPRYFPEKNNRRVAKCIKIVPICYPKLVRNFLKVNHRVARRDSGLWHKRLPDLTVFIDFGLQWCVWFSVISKAVWIKLFISRNLYSGDLNTGLVWYSNGGKLSIFQMFCYSNDHSNSGYLAVQYLNARYSDLFF